MMRVKNLVLRDFKGQSAIHKVAPLNLLVGPNGAGKTTWRDALQWAIAGTTLHGKLASHALAFGGPDGSHVVVELDDGYSWGRGVKTGDEGKVKQWLSFPGNQKLADAAAAVRAHCGDFPEMFDLRLFLGKSAEERRKYLVGLASQAAGEGVGPVALRDRVLCALEGLDNTHSEPLLMPGGLVEAAMSTAPTDTLSRLSAGLACATSLANESKAAHKAATSSVRELSQQLAGVELPTEPIDEMERRLGQMRADRDAAIKIIAHREGLDASRVALTEQREVALRHADELRQDLHEHGKTDVSGWESEAKRRDAQAEALEQHPKPLGSATAWETLDGMLDEVFACVGDEATKRWLSLREFVTAQRRAGDALRDWESAQGQARELRRQAERTLAGYTAHQDKSNELATRIAAQVDRAAGLATKLADIDQQITDHTPLETLETQRDGLAGQIAALDELLKRKRNAATLVVSFQTARQKVEREKAANEVAKALCAAIRKVREGHMGALVKRILEPINAFLEVAAPGKRAYCRLEKPNGQPMFELGWEDIEFPPACDPNAGESDPSVVDATYGFRTGRCVSLDALSGGEAAAEDSAGICHDDGIVQPDGDFAARGIGGQAGRP